ncbi:MAG: dephospho-CoA kinase [Actinobacteria bacterium]|nr:MAG: dephospho-CoA kinase [Actinomycetota bacterium]
MRPRPTRKPPLPPKPLPTSSSSRPVSVAVTGGIGAGKSVALEAFARHGAATRSSDEIVHALLRDDPEVRRALVERFGAEAIGADGADRAAIARVVFNDSEQLQWLEQLLHPRVVQEHSKWQQELAAAPDHPLVAVTEVPLLYETGADERFDHVVVITASPEVRAARRPVDDAREQRLIPDAEKVRLADYSYVNDGTLEELDAFVADVLARLTA